MSAWITGTNLDFSDNAADEEAFNVLVEVSVRNVSNQPIGGLNLEVTLAPSRRARQSVGPISPDGVIMSFPVLFEKVPRGELETEMPGILNVNPTLNVWFVDEAGHSWHRPHGGKLKQASPPKDWPTLKSLRDSMKWEDSAPGAGPGL